MYLEGGADNVHRLDGGQGKGKGRSRLSPRFGPQRLGGWNRLGGGRFGTGGSRSRPHRRGAGYCPAVLLSYPRRAGGRQPNMRVQSSGPARGTHLGVIGSGGGN